MADPAAVMLGRVGRHATAGAAAVVRDNDVTYAVQCPDVGGVVGGNALFEVGSVTKPFVGTALAVLVCEKVLALDDAIGRLMPGLPSKLSRLTLRQLATHTSGLPQGDPPADAPADDLFGSGQADYVLQWLQTHELSEPGRARYSNFGYVLLGAALASAAGQPLSKVVGESVLQPLGMTATVLGERGTGELVAGYRLPNGERVEPLGGGFAAAGGLLTTGEDLGTWLWANLHPDGTPLAEPLRLAQEVHVVLSERRWRRGWGLGWRRSGSIAWLPGTNAGFLALCRLDLHAKVGYAWTINVGIGAERKTTVALLRRGLPLAVDALRAHRATKAEPQ